MPNPVHAIVCVTIMTMTRCCMDTECRIKSLIPLPAQDLLKVQTSLHSQFLSTIRLELVGALLSLSEECNFTACGDVLPDRVSAPEIPPPSEYKCTNKVTQVNNEELSSSLRSISHSTCSRDKCEEMSLSS